MQNSYFYHIIDQKIAISNIHINSMDDYTIGGLF